MPRINLNAWREIIARVFEDFEVTPNITPAWLINPATKRKLKLDLLYPEINLAIRFEGLKATGQPGRISLEEEDQARIRGEARAEVCKEHGISLATLNLSTASLSTIFEELEATMSRATRMLAQNEALTPDEKATRLDKLRRGRGLVAQFRRDITTDRNLDLYSSLWHDRQFQEEENPETEQTSSNSSPTLVKGMEVEHSHFGPGKVVAVIPGKDGTLITIDFFDAGERTFMAELLSDKITIQ